MRTPSLVLSCLFALSVLGGCETLLETTSPVEIRAASTTERSDWRASGYHLGGLDTWVSPDATVTASGIVRARRSIDDLGEPTVILQFDQASSIRMDELTTRRASRPIAIILDGRVIAAPVVTTSVEETLVIHFGRAPDAASNADRLVDAISSRSNDDKAKTIAVQPADQNAD